MVTPVNINDLFSLIDRYVKLNFLVVLVNSNLQRWTDEIDDSLFDIDFGNLGLSGEIQKQLGSHPNLNQLRKYRDEIMLLKDNACTRVFGGMIGLPLDERIALKDYADRNIDELNVKIQECQSVYLVVVERIDEAKRNKDSKMTRQLGRLAKDNYNKMYKYNIMNQFYSNVSNYLRGMINVLTQKK